jgi:phosphotriesterase-related protein
MDSSADVAAGIRHDGRGAHAGHVKRRDALKLIGAAAATGLLTRSLRATPSRRAPIIRTLLADAPPDALGPGAVLFHEHLSMHYPTTNAIAAARGAPPPTHFTDDVALMTEEARLAGRDGVACLVDGGHADMDRNLDALKRIASAAGVHIVASGGYYMERTYPASVASMNADEIADQLVRDARVERWGAFGEIGQQGGVLTELERKVFSAIGKAHVRTGIPIFTHNAYSGSRVANPPIPPEAGLRQLDVLEAAGVDPRHVAIGHVCCLNEPTADVAKAIAKRGAFVGFDRVTLATLPDPQRVVMLKALIDAGYASQLLLSSDFASARSLKRDGGAGLAQTVTVFAPMLVAAGVSPAVVRTILNDNPRRFLAFEPKT